MAALALPSGSIMVYTGLALRWRCLPKRNLLHQPAQSSGGTQMGRRARRQRTANHHTGCRGTVLRKRWPEGCASPGNYLACVSWRSGTWKAQSLRGSMALPRMSMRCGRSWRTCEEELAWLQIRPGEPTASQWSGCRASQWMSTRCDRISKLFGLGRWEHFQPIRWTLSTSYRKRGRSAMRTLLHCTKS